MLFDTSAYYYGQPGVLGSPFVPQGLFGHLQGQPIWPAIGSALGHPQLAACVAPGLVGYLPGQYPSPTWPTIGAAGPQIHGFVPQAGFVPPALVPGPFGLPIAPPIGGLGQPLLAGQFGIAVGPFGRLLPIETGLTAMAAPAFGVAPQIGGWLAQQQLAATVGRSMIPYQTAVPQMAYAGC